VDGGLETKLVRELLPAKFGAGHSGSSLAAVASQRDWGIWLPGNGCPVAGSLMDASDAGKMPCFMASVGTIAGGRLAVALCEALVAAEEESAVFDHRPPTVPPY